MADAEPWRPKYIVLDSTELRADIGFSSTRADFLRAFCQRYDAAVVVPRIVRLEVEAHIRSEVERSATSVVDEAKTLERYGAQFPLGFTAFPFLNTSRWTREAEQQLAQRLDWLQAEDMPLPEVSHDDVVARLLAGQRPFGTAKSSDVGYRDFLLWQTVLSLSGPVAFVTSDRKGFAENGQLHGDLARDLLPGRADVRLFVGLQSLAKDVLRPSFPTTDAANLLLNRDDQRTKLEGFAAEQLAHEELLDYLVQIDVGTVLWDYVSGGGAIEHIDSFIVSSIDEVSLDEGPTDTRMIDGARIVVAYDGFASYTLTADVLYQNGEYEIEDVSISDEPVQLEYTIDVGETEIVPVTVSLTSL